MTLDRTLDLGFTPGLEQNGQFTLGGVILPEIRRDPEIRGKIQEIVDAGQGVFPFLTEIGSGNQNEILI